MLLVHGTLLLLLWRASAFRGVEVRAPGIRELHAASTIYAPIPAVAFSPAGRRVATLLRQSGPDRATHFGAFIVTPWNASLVLETLLTPPHCQTLQVLGEIPMMVLVVRMRNEDVQIVTNDFGGSGPEHPLAALVPERWLGESGGVRIGQPTPHPHN